MSMWLIGMLDPRSTCHHSPPSVLVSVCVQVPPAHSPLESPSTALLGTLPPGPTRVELWVAGRPSLTRAPRLVRGVPAQAHCRAAPLLSPEPTAVHSPSSTQPPQLRDEQHSARDSASMKSGMLTVPALVQVSSNTCSVSALASESTVLEHWCMKPWNAMEHMGVHCCGGAIPSQASCAQQIRSISSLPNNKRVLRRMQLRWQRYRGGLQLVVDLVPDAGRRVLSGPREEVLELAPVVVRVLCAAVAAAAAGGDEPGVFARDELHVVEEHAAAAVADGLEGDVEGRTGRADGVAPHLPFLCSQRRSRQSRDSGRHGTS